ncbi:MAG: hypothetical protein DRP25_01265 [Thermotoga sp.]|nr:MAG: hypothetical protein DRP25_01265 [Thermotoga sp.]
MNWEKLRDILSEGDKVFLLEKGPLGSETLLIVSDDPDIEDKIEEALSEDIQSLMVVSHEEFKMMKVKGKRIV